MLYPKVAEILMKKIDYSKLKGEVHDKLEFPPNNDGATSGFNDGAIDTFAGNRLSSVVREIIQNSLDAKKNSDEPVRLASN